MSTFRKILGSEKGSIVFALIVAGVVGGLAFILMNWQDLYFKSIKHAEESVEFQIEYYSASDTLYYAYKKEEQKYLKALVNCSTAKPFIQAIKEGSGCATEVNVFKLLDSGDASLYSFGPGCRIRSDESSCGSGTPLILSIQKSNAGNNPLNPFRYYNYEFYIFGIIPEKSIIEFLVIASDASGQKRILGNKRKRTLALVDNLRNIAHIEPDGRVTEENPSPTNRCNGSPWQDLRSFNPSNLECEKFKILGGAEGLAYYSGRYFGFKQYDGQVFDLLSTISGNGFKVDENGMLDGKKIFPKYSKTELQFVDDITVVEDNIYYVAGNGMQAHIGVLDTSVSPAERKKICEVGTMGWGQSYVGILALARSQNLLDQTKVGNSATFYLKSSSGDLVTFLAMINTSGNYECYGLKDSNLQQVEYRRTYGFDRTEDNTSMYYY